MAISQPPVTVKTYKMYIDGEWVDSASGETFDVINPSDGQVFARVPKAGLEDTRRAIAAARRAFDNGVWSNMDPRNRLKKLLDVVHDLSDRREELAELEAMNSGSTIRKTNLFDVPFAIEHFRHFAEMAIAPAYEPLPWIDMPHVSWNFVQREPIGVCAQIVPWNVPLLMAVWKLAPALAAGNCVVIKPASYTPLTALEIAKAFEKTDIPKGVINVITGNGSVIGEEMASNPMVDKVAFTGSTVVGRRIMELASRTVKKVTLELGGKSPNIILEDADIDLAVDGALFGTFFHQGQLCESGTRLFLPASIHDEFVEKLVARAKEIKIGPSMDYESTMGPVISNVQLNTVEEYIKLGLEEGATLVLGGKRPTGPEFEGGYFIEPTIFTNVRNNMRIAQEEIFGPVLAVIKYEDVDEAIQMANDSIYGLAGAVWSRNVPDAIEVAKKLRTGTVWINDYHLLNAAAPFGGFKQSGVGRELGTYGFKEYTQIKHIHVDLGSKRETRFWYDLVIS